MPRASSESGWLGPRLALTMASGAVTFGRLEPDTDTNAPSLDLCARLRIVHASNADQLSIAIENRGKASVLFERAEVGIDIDGSPRRVAALRTAYCGAHSRSPLS